MKGGRRDLYWFCSNCRQYVRRHPQPRLDKYPGRPYCLACRGPMIHGVSNLRYRGRELWSCKKCGTSTFMYLQSPPPSGNPSCVPCRRAMHKGGLFWKCPSCGSTARVRITARSLPATIWCLCCRSPMRRLGRIAKGRPQRESRDQYQCQTCGIYLSTGLKQKSRVKKNVLFNPQVVALSDFATCVASQDSTVRSPRCPPNCHTTYTT
jgi:hypothetical protein